MDDFVRKIVPNPDHLGIHCNVRESPINEETGKRIVSAGALRIDKDGLSATWLEFFPGDEEERFLAACEATARGGRTPKKSHALALFVVGRVRAVIRTAGFAADVVHDPVGQANEPNFNPAHCLVTGLPVDSDQNAEVRQLIAGEAEEVRSWPGSLVQ